MGTQAVGKQPQWRQMDKWTLVDTQLLRYLTDEQMDQVAARHKDWRQGRQIDN